MSKTPQEAHEYYLKNKDRILSRSKKFYAENRTTILERHKQMRQTPENRAYRKEYLPKYRSKNPHKVWATHSINNHKKEGLCVRFSINELESFAKENGAECYYCKKPLSWNNCGLQENSPNLDRIDNEKLLTLNNIQILCWRCNLIKGNLPEKDFIEHLTRLVDHFAFGGSKHDPERIRIIREKGEKG